MKTVETLMKDAVELNLLKNAAGQNIFCPSCQRIMDCRETVIATIYASSPKIQEKIVAQYCSCAKCFDKRKHNLEKGIADSIAKNPEVSARIEIVDGRDSRFNDVE